MNKLKVKIVIYTDNLKVRKTSRFSTISEHEDNNCTETNGVSQKKLVARLSTELEFERSLHDDEHDFQPLMNVCLCTLQCIRHFPQAL